MKRCKLFWWSVE